MTPLIVAFALLFAILLFAKILLRMKADMDAERRQRQLLEDQYR